MALSMKDRLDGLPLSRWHWNVMLICSLGFLFDGMDNMMISFALPVLISTWKLTSRQAGIIGSAGVVGMVIGSFVFGILADYRGRRYVFQTTILVYSLFTGFCALSANWVMLIVFRLIVGTGVGGLIPVDTAYLTEMTPPKYRGKFLSLFNGAWPIGAAVAGLLSYFLVPVFGWRILFVIGVLPALIVFWIRRSLPESPRYLVSRKKFEEAKREIFKIEKRVLGKTSEEEIVFDTNVEQPPRSSFAELWTRRLLKSTIVSMILWWCLSFAYFGIFIWLPTLLTKMGVPVARGYLLTTITLLSAIPGFVAAAYSVEIFGRKKTLVVSFILFAFFTYMFFHATTQGTALAALMPLSFFNEVAWCAVYAYTPELFPTRARGTGGGWASTFGRTGSIIAPSIVGFFVDISRTTVMWVFVGVLILAAVTTLVGIETKGKRLEDLWPD